MSLSITISIATITRTISASRTSVTRCGIHPRPPRGARLAGATCGGPLRAFEQEEALRARALVVSFRVSALMATRGFGCGSGLQPLLGGCRPEIVAVFFACDKLMARRLAKAQALAVSLGTNRFRGGVAAVAALWGRSDGGLLRIDGNRDRHGCLSAERSSRRPRTQRAVAEHDSGSRGAD